MKTLSMFLVAAALAGCTAPAPDPSGPGDDPAAGADAAVRAPARPHLSLLLTDAPAEFEQVWVNIASVELESSEDGWLRLTDTPQRFDLLTLRDDVTAALGGATLEPGSYGQLRLIVDQAEVVIGGVSEPLRIASGAQTGIKIPLDATFAEDMTYTLTLDFDAARSVKATGQGWLMTPVIHVDSLIGTPVEPPVEPPVEVDAGVDAPEPEGPAPDAAPASEADAAAETPVP